MTRTWITQCLTGFLLLVTVWAFLNMPDQRPWQVGLSALLAVLAMVVATFMVGHNFSGSRALKPLVAGSIVLFLALLWLSSAFDVMPVATWLASAITLKRKKPIEPFAVSQWLEWGLSLIRWIVIPLILLPIAIRAAGVKPVRFLRLVPIYVAVFLIGAVLPHYIVHWVPKLAGLPMELISMVLRFGAAWLLTITAWVALGRLSS